jgi:hypothetical protein
MLVERVEGIEAIRREEASAMRHEWKMVVGCVLPLLLVFVLPLFGFGEGTALVVFLVLMFGCHQFMMGGHHGAGSRGSGGDAHPEREVRRGDT